MILGLRTCIYPVADLEGARQWYSKVLGAEPYFNEVFYVGFAVGGFELGLVPSDTASVLGTQLLWGVDDIAAEFQRLTALGATEIEAVHDVGDNILVAAVKDPFGNRLGLIQNPHFKVTEVR